MAKSVRKFPVDLFVDKEEGKSNVRAIAVELFDRRDGEVVYEEIEDGSLQIRPHGSGENGEGIAEFDCISITDTSYADGRAKFRAEVRGDFIRDADFLSRITKPILYQIEAKPKPLKRSKKPLEPIQQVLDFRISVASIQWRWWLINKENILESAPRDAHFNEPIEFDPEGWSGFRLELWVEEFNRETRKFEKILDDHDYSHWLSPKGGKLTLEELAAKPLPWESKDSEQRCTNWFSAKDLTGPEAKFEFPCSSALQVDAYSKRAIVERIPEPPFVKAKGGKVATREIPLRLRKLEFALEAIDGENPAEKLPLPAAAERIPAKGYKLRLRLYDGDEVAAGVRVKVGTWKEGGWQAFGAVSGDPEKELTSGKDGTVEFFYKPEPLALGPEDFRKDKEFEERFEILARRHDRARPYRIHLKKTKGVAGATAGQPSLAVGLEPELKLKFYKKPFVFEDPETRKPEPVEAQPEKARNGKGRTGRARYLDLIEKAKRVAHHHQEPQVKEEEAAAPAEGMAKALEPYSIDLGQEMSPEARKQFGEIIERGGEIHLKARLASEGLEEAKVIRDGSWCSDAAQKEGVDLDKWDDWLDPATKEVSVLRFPPTGRGGGAVAKPLEFEAEFRLIPPIEAQMKEIEKRAAEVEKSLGTGSLGAKARSLVERCVEEIAVAGEEKLDGDMEAFLETIVTVPHFLRSTVLAKEAVDVSLDLQERAYDCFRESYVDASFDFLTFQPIVKSLEKSVEKAGADASQRFAPRLISEYLGKGQEAAVRLSKELRNKLPRDSFEAVRKLVGEQKEEIKTAARTSREEAEGTQRALKRKTDDMVELARKIVPLKRAETLHEKNLKLLREELPTFKKAAEDTSERLANLTEEIAALRKKLAHSGEARAEEAASLEELRKTAREDLEAEEAVEKEVGELGAKLKEKTEETGKAKEGRDEAEANLVSLKGKQEGLETEESDARNALETDVAEADRLEGAIENSTRARESAVTRQDGLERKLGDRKAATAAAKQEAGSASEKAQRATEVVKEKRAARQALKEAHEKLEGQLSDFESAEAEAREMVGFETEKLTMLKNESPPDAAKIREVEKARVEASRLHDAAKEDLAEHELKVERAERAVLDAERTIGDLSDNEGDSVRFADERTDHSKRAAQLEEEQDEMVRSNLEEIERLTGEVKDLKKSHEAAVAAREEAKTLLATKEELVRQNDAAVGEAQVGFGDAAKAYADLEAERLEIEETHSDAMRRLESSAAKAATSQRKVEESEERLAGLKKEGKELRAAEEKGVSDETEAKKQSEEAADKLQKHEGEIADTEKALEETQAELAPLEEELVGAKEGWEEARSAERSASDQLAEKVLARSNLKEWEKRLEKQKEKIDTIATEERDPMSEKLASLADAFPEDERHAITNEDVKGVLAKRKEELEKRIAALNELPAETREVIEVGGLIESWGERSELDGDELVGRFAGTVDELWGSLDVKIAEARGGADDDLAGQVAALKSDAPPSGEGEFYGKAPGSWAKWGVEIGRASDWIREMRGKPAGFFMAWIPDAVSIFFHDWVFWAFVKALSWIHHIQVRVTGEVGKICGDPDFGRVSALSEEARSQARGFIDARELCPAEYFSFVPAAEKKLAEDLNPEALLAKATSESMFGSLREAIEDEARRGYEKHYPKQRKRAVRMFEELCGSALDPKRIGDYEPVENLRQRREATSVLGSLSKNLNETWEAFVRGEGGGVSDARVLALGEESRWNSKDWKSLLEWSSWTLSWGIRVAALTLVVPAGGITARSVRVSEAVEAATANLRRAGAAIFAYPRILAYQRDVLLAHSLAYQAFFEKYELPGANNLVTELAEIGEEAKEEPPASEEKESKKEKGGGDE